MADSVDVLRAHRHENAADGTASPDLDSHVFTSIEAAIQAWLDDAGTPASFDRSYTHACGHNRVAVVIEYTSV